MANVPACGTITDKEIIVSLNIENNKMVMMTKLMLMTWKLWHVPEVHVSLKDATSSLCQFLERPEVDTDR